MAKPLIVEVTETSALIDIEESARFLQTIRELGCRVAVDDFGAGYTSFRHLKALTLDIVKIDGSFVKNLAGNVDNQLFIRNLLGLADTYGMETVAECVETQEDAHLPDRRRREVSAGLFLRQAEPGDAAAEGLSDCRCW